MMKVALKIVIGAALVLAGCARFEHQTSGSEPHGVVRFDEPVVVKSFDGLPVSPGKYRVKPGRHELVYQVRESHEKILAPVNIGVGMLPPTVEREYHFRNVTNVVTIEADWLYDVEGVEFKKTMFQGQ